MFCLFVYFLVGLVVQFITHKGSEAGQPRSLRRMRFSQAEVGAHRRGQLQGGHQALGLAAGADKQTEGAAVCFGVSGLRGFGGGLEAKGSWATDL